MTEHQKMSPEMARDYPAAVEWGRRVKSGEAWRDSPVRKRYFTWYGPAWAFLKWLWFPF
jgi:hypothetical protein